MNAFHEHACPECSGYWTHEDGNCLVPDGDDLTDPSCEGEIASDLLGQDDLDTFDVDFDVDLDWADEDKAA